MAVQTAEVGRPLNPETAVPRAAMLPKPGQLQG
jgi:hypothetical protein